jgi:hypothetical protein
MKNNDNSFGFSPEYTDNPEGSTKARPSVDPEKKQPITEMAEQYAKAKPQRIVIRASIKDDKDS